MSVTYLKEGKARKAMKVHETVKAADEAVATIRLTEDVPAEFLIQAYEQGKIASAYANGKWSCTAKEAMTVNGVSKAADDLIAEVTMDAGPPLLFAFQAYEFGMLVAVESVDPGV